MTYSHLLPVDTIVTCIYDPQDRPERSYSIAALVVGKSSAISIWRILYGGWNHSAGSTYGLPDVDDPDYHSFVIHTPDTFPYPELLI